MNKFLKALFRTAGFTAIAGVFALVVGLAAGATPNSLAQRLSDREFPSIYYEDGLHWHLGKEDTVTAGDISMDFEQADVQKLHIEVAAGDMKIAVSKDNKIHLRADGLSDVLKITCEGGMLSIRNVDWNSVINTNFLKNKIVVLELPKDLKLSEAVFEIGAGDLDVDAISAKKIRLEVGAGDADFLDAATDDLEIECGAGDVKAAILGKESDYSVDVDLGAGSVTVGSRSFSGVGVDEKIEGNTDKEISVECGMGDVRISFGTE